MKIKNTKFFLCGILVALFLVRNLQDGQFVMSLFFSVVSWQCLRASLGVKGLEDMEPQALAALRGQAEKEVYGSAAKGAWMLPYLVLAVCAGAGALIPGMRMPAVYLFIAVLLAELAVGCVIGKKMKQLLEQ